MQRENKIKLESLQEKNAYETSSTKLLKGKYLV